MFPRSRQTIAVTVLAVHAEVALKESETSRCRVHDHDHSGAYLWQQRHEQVVGSVVRHEQPSEWIIASGQEPVHAGGFDLRPSWPPSEVAPRTERSDISVNGIRLHRGTIRDPNSGACEALPRPVGAPVRVLFRFVLGSFNSNAQGLASTRQSLHAKKHVVGVRHRGAETWAAIEPAKEATNEVFAPDLPAVRNG